MKQETIVLTQAEEKLFNTIVAEKKSNDFVYHQLEQTLLDNRNQVVPFIGAGLSSFAFLGWGEVLELLLSQSGEATNGNNQTKVQEIRALIAEGDFFSAADKLETLIESDFFYYSLVSSFREEKFVSANGPSIPENAAVRWLPKVFPNSRLITTNYDSVIEWAYAEQQLYLRTATPRDDRMFMQFMPRRLFKIHGSYDSNYEDIVLTSKSYEAKYSKNSRLYYNFMQMVRSSVLLFLGTSLRKDKTLDLLSSLASELKTQETTGRSHYCGNMHFAIAHLNDNEEDLTRRQELAKYKILPILFNDKQHTDLGFEKYAIVSIILKKLYLALNPKNSLSSSAMKDNEILSIDTHPSSHQQENSQNSEKPNTSRLISRWRTEDPLNAFAVAMLQHDLALAESMTAELESALPKEIYIKKVLTVLASHGSTPSALKLFALVKNEAEYNTYTLEQKNDILGSLVSYCNRQDVEEQYLSVLENALNKGLSEANEVKQAYIYNQLARLYFGAHSNNPTNPHYYKKALDYSKCSVQLDPNEASYSYNLAIILRETSLEESIKAVEKCLELGSQDVDHLTLAFELFSETKDNRASSLLEEIESKNPGRAKLIMLRDSLPPHNE